MYKVKTLKHLISFNINVNTNKHRATKQLFHTLIVNGYC